MRAVAVFVFLVLLLGSAVIGTWWFLRPGATGPRPVVQTPVAAPDSGPAPTLEGPPDPGPSRAEERSAAAEEPSGSRSPGYRAALCGLTGRVVRRDGTPVPDLPVTLYGMQRQLLMPLFGRLLEDGGAPFRLEHSSARTDRDGRFVFRDVEPRGWYLLGLDPGGGHGALRGVTVAFESGQAADLGDVVLDPGGAISGRVIGEHGGPVVGARVRWSTLPGSSLLSGALRAAPGSALASENEWTVIEIPGWFLQLVETFPTPAVVSDGDGVFRLTGIPDAEGGLAVQRDGFAPGWVDVVQSASGGDRHVGAVVLTKGRTLRVHVIDEAGQAVPSAEVLGGLSDDEAAVLVHRAVRREGVFEVIGLQGSGEPFVVARRSADHPWMFPGLVDGFDTTVTLPAARAVDLWVRDKQGWPVSDAELTLLSSFSKWSVSMASLAPRAARSSLLVLPPERCREVEPGHYRLTGLGPGAYGLLVQTEDGAAFDSFHLPPDRDTLLTVVLEPTQPLVVRVVDPVGRPVSEAMVSVTGWAQGRTDADGRVRLPRVSVTGEASFIDVAHPAFAKFQGVLSRLSLADDEPHLTVSLSAGGGLVVRVTDGGHTPPDPYLVVLGPTRHGQAAFDEFFPWMAHTDRAGVVRWGHLTPGSHRVEVYPGQTQAPVLQALFSPLAPGPQEIVAHAFVREGENVEVHVDVTGRQNWRPTQLGGRVLVNGVPAEGLHIRIKGSADERTLTDASGGFDFGLVAPGAVALEVRDASISTSALHVEDVDLPAGGRRFLELAIELCQLRVRTVDETGQPVGFAELAVEFDSFSDSSVTGRDGTATFLVPRAGRYRVRAGHSEAGFGNGEVEVPPGRLQEVTLTLRVGVPCEGVLLLDDTYRKHMDRLMGRYGFAVSSWDRQWFMMAQVDEDGRFRVRGLPPGRYHARLPIGPSVDFELPAKGRTDLVLDFRGDDGGPGRDR